MQLDSTGRPRNPEIVAYLNRLPACLQLLTCYGKQAGVEHPTFARED